MTADLVSGIGVTRSREPAGLQRMMMVSSIAHAAAIAALVSASWSLGPHHTVGEALMPRGLPTVPSAIWTDVAAPEGMVEHVTRTTPKPAAPQPAASTKPAPRSTGTEVRPRPAHVGNDSTSTAGSLSTGVLPGTNGLTSHADFCDPEYLGQMVALIHRNWQQNQNVAGRPIVRFAILRDGTLTGITLRQPSGYPGLDLAAMRAVTLTRAIPPLPACYPHPHYAMNLTFEYSR